MFAWFSKPCNLGFLDEHVDVLFVAGVLLADALECEHTLKAAESFLLRLEDFCHSARRDPLDDLVVAEMGDGLFIAQVFVSQSRRLPPARVREGFTHLVVEVHEARARSRRRCGRTFSTSASSNGIEVQRVEVEARPAVVARRDDQRLVGAIGNAPRCTDDEFGELTEVSPLEASGVLLHALRCGDGCIGLAVEEEARALYGDTRTAVALARFVRGQDGVVEPAARPLPSGESSGEVIPG